MIPPVARPMRIHLPDDLMTERARVLRVSGGIAWVQCETQAGCARCAAGEGCGAGLFAKLLRGRLQELPVNVPTELAGRITAGDPVLLGLSVSAIQNASLLLYGVPLAGLLLGAIGGSQVLMGDAGAFVGALAGLCAGLWFARWRGAALGERLEPVLLRALAEHEPCPARREA